MKKLLLLSLVLFGCMGGQDAIGQNDDSINPGLYEQRENFMFAGAFIEMVHQSRLSANKTFFATTHVNAIPFMESKGNWSATQSTMLYTEVLQRISNDDGTWGPWIQVSDGTDQIRNITNTSYQRYVDASKLDPVWQEYATGISTGWRTCNRIGD